MLSIILLVFAFVLFMVANFSPDPPWRSRLICYGLACWVLAELVVKVPLLTR